MTGRRIELGKVILPDSSFCSWFAGLTDGEGCFYIGNNGCSFIITLILALPGTIIDIWGWLT